jgi:hypothetical protein
MWDEALVDLESPVESFWNYPSFGNFAGKMQPDVMP